MAKTILIMAGGTGGHVFPGIAAAHLLQAEGHHVEWLGTQHGLDTLLVPKANIPLHKISIRGLRGKNKLSLLLAPFKVVYAIAQSVKILRQLKPDVVLGMGGYVTGPGGIAAWLLRIPLIIHEQNAIAGKTNLWLSHFSTQNLVAFPDAFPQHIKTTWVGNPVRSAIAQLPLPTERLAARQGKINILVFGGSQGAQAINQLVPRVLAKFPDSVRPVVWHQSGEKHLADLTMFYQTAQVDAKLFSFIDDMAQAYAWADLVICRAGALSVSEIAAAGVASILIPFPQAVDDHQTANANFLVKAGAAYCLQEKTLTELSLYQLLLDLMQNRSMLLSMANAARQLAKPNATHDVIMACLKTHKNKD